MAVLKAHIWFLLGPSFISSTLLTLSAPGNSKDHAVENNLP